MKGYLPIQVIYSSWRIDKQNKLSLFLRYWRGTGYNAAVDPQVDQLFQVAAMRFGHTLVPSGD